MECFPDTLYQSLISAPPLEVEAHLVALLTTARGKKAKRCTCHGIYLALDPCDAAGTGLRVAENSAITAAVLPGHPDSSQFMFLLHINLLYPRGAQQRPALFRGERLQEEVVVHLCVVEIDVIV